MVFFCALFLAKYCRVCLLGFLALELQFNRLRVKEENMPEKQYKTRIIRQTKADRRLGIDRRDHDRRHIEPEVYLTREEIAALLSQH